MPQVHPTTRQNLGLIGRWRAIPGFRRLGLEMVFMGLVLGAVTVLGYFYDLLTGAQQVLYPMAAVFALITGLGLFLSGGGSTAEAEEHKDAPAVGSDPDNPMSELYERLSGGPVPKRQLLLGWIVTTLVIVLVIHLVRPMSVDGALTAAGITTVVYSCVLCFLWAAYVGHRRRRSADGSNQRADQSLNAD